MNVLFLRFCNQCQSQLIMLRQSLGTNRSSSHGSEVWVENSEEVKWHLSFMSPGRIDVLHVVTLAEPLVWVPPMEAPGCRHNGTGHPRAGDRAIDLLREINVWQPNSKLLVQNEYIPSLLHLWSMNIRYGTHRTAHRSNDSIMTFMEDKIHQLSKWRKS